MKFLDFTALLETDPANLAVLSTFQFDANFFEQRLLRCSALAKARRILVFMDAGQWFNLLRQDVPARWLNRRYLVVPVRPPKGVFHPKLNLMVRDDGGMVQCGSNNLTRSGCSSNLELLNSFSITLDKQSEESVWIAQEAYQFFKHACDDSDQEAGRIARQWLDELPRDAPWIATEFPPIDERTTRLVHTYDGSLWDELITLINGESPKRFFVISPFFDKDAEMVRRIRQRWPRCEIEFVVQQKTTTLPIAGLKMWRQGISLSELRNSSRRLHAKLVAWETSKGTGCLVGSANFTTAALDAHNVEVCLLISDAAELVSGLFDGQFTKRPLAFDDFEPSTEAEPEAEDDDKSTLRINSALLTEKSEIKVNYRHQLTTKPSSLRIALRVPGESRPRTMLNLPNTEHGAATVIPNEAILKDAHGTILATLVAEIGNQREESHPIWVIQEERLTHDSSGEGSASAKARVEETGEGLVEFLEELGNREGITAVIEYLHRLNIRFNDGGGGLRGGRTFRLRVRDPFRPDVAPEWLLDAQGDTGNLLQAIYDFVDRHDKQRLRKHAKRGNINGMENFLDILTALVLLLYRYHRRGIVPRPQLIGRLCNYVDIATCGGNDDQLQSEGYMYSLYNNLGGSDYLQEVCNELNFLGHIRAVLVIAQRIRFVPRETSRWGKSASRPCECLPDQRKHISDTIKDLELNEPSKDGIMKSLGEYKMFSKEELAEIEKEIEA